MISYGSAIIGAPRCVRTLDPAARLGQAMPVCGAPVAGGPGLRARYCPACVARLITRVGSRPGVPRFAGRRQAPDLAADFSDEKLRDSFGLRPSRAAA